MSQVTLNPTADTYLTALTPDTNNDAITFDVGEWNGGVGDVRRTLIKFDLSSIPNSSIITVATLRVYDTGSDLTSNTRTMFANRSKRAWTETGATWNKYDGTNNWATAGGGTNADDVELANIGSVSMPDPPVAQYYEISLAASKIQEWLSGIFTNNGLMLSMGTETDDLHRLDSSEGTNKPELVITYPTPGFLAIL